MKIHKNKLKIKVKGQIIRSLISFISTRFLTSSKAYMEFKNDMFEIIWY